MQLAISAHAQPVFPSISSRALAILMKSRGLLQTGAGSHRLLVRPDMRKFPPPRFSSRKAPRTAAPVEIHAIFGLPEIEEGDDLSEVIATAAGRARMVFKNGDVLVVAQKIV